MELTGLFPIIRRWLAVILVATAAATVIGLALGLSADKTYEARSELLVGPLSTDTDTMRASGDLSQTYAQLATSNSVLSTAARDLHIPASQLRTGVRATANSTTRFLVVRARSHDAGDAADIANSISLQLLDLGKQDPTRPEGQLRVIDPARTPTTPVSPRLDLIIPLAAVAGLLGSLTLVLLFEFAGDTAESIDKVDALTGVPTLAVKRPRARHAVAGGHADLEPYRVIVTQIDLAAPDVRSVLVTGVTERDGTAGLAQRLAEVWSHRRTAVTLLDAATGELIVVDRAGRWSGTGDPADRAVFDAVGGHDPEAVTIAEASTIVDRSHVPGGILIVHGQAASVSSATLTWARVADVTVLSVRRFQARRSMITDAVVNLRAVHANLALGVLHERSRGPADRDHDRGHRGRTDDPHDEPTDPADPAEPAGRSLRRRPPGTLTTGDPQAHEGDRPDATDAMLETGRHR